MRFFKLAIPVTGISVLILVVLAALQSGRALGAESTAVSSGPGSQVAYIRGEIALGGLVPVDNLFLKAKPGSSVTLIVDSPGGSVSEARTLIRTMHKALAHQVHINCVVDGEAISAAFWILTPCSTRWSVSHSTFLFHRVRIQTSAPITASIAASLARQLGQLDREMVEDIQGACFRLGGPSSDFLWKHMDLETAWTPEGLNEALPGFLTGTSDTVAGLEEAEESPQTVRLQAPKQDLMSLFFPQRRGVQ